MNKKKRICLQIRRKRKGTIERVFPQRKKNENNKKKRNIYKKLEKKNKKM